MADTYGVLGSDVAAELPGLYPAGFDETSLPSADQVATMITTADTIITLHVRSCVGTTPAQTDVAAPIARRFVIDWVKAQVVRIAYAGNDAAQVAAAAQPYADLAKESRDAITAMGAQAEGDGTPAPRLTGQMSTRDLVLDDCDLDPAQRGRF